MLKAAVVVDVPGVEILPTDAKTVSSNSVVPDASEVPGLISLLLVLLDEEEDEEEEDLPQELLLLLLDLRVFSARLPLPDPASTSI